MNKLYLIAAALLLSSLAVEAKELRCTYSGSEEYWIKSIVIDTANGRVSLSREREEGMEGQLIYADDSKINGYPAYAFNSPVPSKPGMVNVFKLFKPFDKWRLIEAGILFVNGQPTLIALGKSVEFKCQ